MREVLGDGRFQCLIGKAFHESNRKETAKEPQCNRCNDNAAAQPVTPDIPPGYCCDHLPLSSFSAMQRTDNGHPANADKGI